MYSSGGTSKIIAVETSHGCSQSEATSFLIDFVTDRVDSTEDDHHWEDVWRIAESMATEESQQTRLLNIKEKRSQNMSVSKWENTSTPVKLESKDDDTRHLQGHDDGAAALATTEDKPSRNDSKEERKRKKEEKKAKKEAKKARKEAKKKKKELKQED